MADGHGKKPGKKKEAQMGKQNKKQIGKGEQDYEIVRLLSDIKTCQDISLRIAEYRSR